MDFFSKQDLIQGKNLFNLNLNYIRRGPTSNMALQLIWQTPIFKESNALWNKREGALREICCCWNNRKSSVD